APPPPPRSPPLPYTTLFRSLALELAATLPAPARSDLHASLEGIQPLRTAWLALYAELARETGMYVAAGSFLLRQGNGRYRNRCRSEEHTSELQSRENLVCRL